MAKRRQDPEYRARQKVYLEKWHQDPENHERKKKTDAQWYNQNARRIILERKGLTQEQYDAMVQKQQGLCAICGGPPRGRWKNHLMVDHDHSTQEVRGLLCTWCNLGLGKFQDNPELLEKAAQYLRRNTR